MGCLYVSLSLHMMGWSLGLTSTNGAINIQPATQTGLVVAGRTVAEETAPRLLHAVRSGMHFPVMSVFVAEIRNTTTTW